MYAVISYYNYRKENFFKLLKVFKAIESAKTFAKDQAQKDLEDWECDDPEQTQEVVQEIEDEYLYMENDCEIYTFGDGYGKMVYAVVELPEAE